MAKSLNDIPVSKHDFNKAASGADIPITEPSPAIPKPPVQGTTSVYPQIEEVRIKMPGGPDGLVIKPETKPALTKDVLIEKVKGQLAKAKAWTDNNRELAIGAAAAGGLATIASLATLIPIFKAKAARKRAGRGKREGRFMRRAVDEYSGLEQDFDDDEFLEWLAGLADDMDEE